MNKEYVKLKKLQAEYLCLLGIAHFGKDRARQFESESALFENCEKEVTRLENMIEEVKLELSSNGVDTNSCLKA